MHHIEYWTCIGSPLSSVHNSSFINYFQLFCMYIVNAWRVSLPSKHRMMFDPLHRVYDIFSNQIQKKKTNDRLQVTCTCSIFYSSFFHKFSIQTIVLSIDSCWLLLLHVYVIPLEFHSVNWKLMQIQKHRLIWLKSGQKDEKKK